MDAKNLKAWSNVHLNSSATVCCDRCGKYVGAYKFLKAVDRLKIVAVCVECSGKDST